MSITMSAHRERVGRLMRQRNAASQAFFAREAERLARVAARMAERFERGGRLLAFGSGSAATDAQHVAVEFVHPVLVGKRALPALNLSATYEDSLPALLRTEDIVVGISGPGGDPEIEAALRDAQARGALCLALPGMQGDYTMAPGSDDPFIHQEIVEILYHTLWETVHVFFDRQPLRQESGHASFLYPFLGGAPPAAEDIIVEVAASIRSKAQTVAELREGIGTVQADRIGAAADGMRSRIEAGGTVLCFGNGGSATDATDLALDLVRPPKAYAPVPAMSLADDPATLTAIANDIGAEAVFLRQLIAHARPGDVAMAISTSGGSPNIVAALREARARGLLTVALLGYDGGEIVRHGLAEHNLVVASDQIPRVQEAHASIYHALVDLLAVPRQPS